MKTTFVIQKRFPTISKKTDPRRQWHDSPEVEPSLTLKKQIKECQALQDESTASEHRLIKRTEEVIFTAKKPTTKQL